MESTAETNSEGIYTVSQLRDGQYTLTARSDGFKEFVVRDIQLVARDYRRVDVTLEVGQVEAKVEVSSGNTVIETETARISDTRDIAQLRDMPLNSRAIWAQLALAPNVLQASAGSTIRFSGSRTNQSFWSIDGTTMSDGMNETQIGPLAQYVESFQEIRIDSANNSAEFGTIGQVTMISKAGTNNFHGSLFDYYSTPWFRARNPFATARATGISHLPGGSAGGPVYIPGVYDGRNKTFIFGSFENFLGSQASSYLQYKRSSLGLALRGFFGDHNADHRSAERPAFPQQSDPLKPVEPDVGRHTEPLLSSPQLWEHVRVSGSE